MKLFTPLSLSIFFALACAFPGCKTTGEATSPEIKSGADADEEVESKEGESVNRQLEVDRFLEEYLKELAAVEKRQALAYWDAANSGKKEDWDVYAEADLELKKLHSDKSRYEKIIAFLEHKDELSPTTVRSLQVAELDFKENQLPKDVLEKLVELSSKINKDFNTFRAKLDGKTLSNNELLEMLAKEKKNKKRQKIWEALKQVGETVGPQIVALAKVRNEGARALGYANFWDMTVRLQEHNPAQLLTIFDELEKETNVSFKKMKAELDAELAKKFRIKADALMPWHYDNPFFQTPPPSAAVDLDEFYKDKNKEDIVELSRVFYADIELPIDDIIARSDLFEREGKDQHAFCMTVDRGQDVRTLTNIKPTADWMGTMLHEQGHALYYKHIDPSLPFNLREAAHIFSTEAVAMYFGALASDPKWLVDYAGADAKRVEEVRRAIREQRRREQLIFARWTMVMLHFEKAMYENPDQDLNTLWWDHVEKYQLLKRPENRDKADWAAKPHFTIAPVYYHNYMLGELFAAQIRAKTSEMLGQKGSTSPISFKGKKELGAWFKEKVFAPGMSQPWPKFVESATGSPLSAEYFAAELE